MGGGAGNEFQTGGLQSLGPLTSPVAQISKEEGKPWSHPCLAGSKCFVMAQSIRNQLGLRVLSCKCGFWVMMVMKQMETLTQQQKAAVCHQTQAGRKAGAAGPEVNRITTGLGTSAWCPLGRQQST